MFSLFNFSSIFPGAQLTPFAPMCGRPCYTVGSETTEYDTIRWLLLMAVAVDLNREHGTTR